MASVTVYTAARMKLIEDASVISGAVDENYDLILTKYDNTTVNAGYVRGPQGLQGVPGEVTLEDLKTAIPAGIVSMCLDAVPAGWYELNGQTISNAQNLWPDLWAYAPAKWKSGSAIILPDMSARFPIGRDDSDAQFSAPENAGGSKTKVLAKNNIPKHYHEMDHNHASANTSSDTHNHTMNDVTPSMSIGNNSHSHEYLGGIYRRAVESSNPNASAFTALSIESYAVRPGYSVRSDTHSHSISGGSHKHTNVADAHYHSLDLPTFYGNTEDGTETGLSNNSFDIMNPYFVVKFIIKA